MSDFKVKSLKPKTFIFLASIVFVSVIYGLPNIILQSSIEDNGRYLPFSDTDELRIYGPLVDQIIEGGKKVGDPALIEHKNDTTLFPKFGPLFLGNIGKLLGLNVTELWQIADFVLPPIIFIASFLTTFLVTGNFYFSVGLSLAFVFTRELATFIPFSIESQFKSFVSKFIPFVPSGIYTPLPVGRLLSPLITLIPLWFFTLSFVWLIRKKNVLSIIFCGLAYGLLFYSYPFDWILISVVLGIFCLYSLLQKDLRLFYSGVLATTIGLTISIPFWFSYFDITTLPHYLDLIDRPGVEHHNMFRASIIPHYLLWTFLTVFIWKNAKENPHLRFAASVMTSGIIVHNIQIITGVVPGPEHFFMYSLTVPLWISYIIIAMWFIDKLRERKLDRFFPILKVIFVLLLILILVKSVQIPIGYASQIREASEIKKPIYEALSWLKENSLKEDVVTSTDVYINSLILNTTPQRIFVPTQASISMASNKEIIERFVITLKILGYESNEITKYMNEKDNRGAVLAYAFYKNDVDTVSKGWTIDEQKIVGYNTVINETILEWEKDSGVLLNKYKLDYLFLSKNKEEALSRLEIPSICFEKVYENDFVEIFKKCGPNKN